MNTPIRQATSNDIEQIVPLLIALDKFHAQKYPDVFDESKISSQIRKEFLTGNMDKSDNLFLVAEIDLKIVGIIHCYTQEIKDHSIKRDKKAAILSDLFVIENSRNNGLAEQLIKRSLEHVKLNWEINDVFLNVFDGNQNAINLYKKSGFKKLFTRYSINI